MRLDVNNSQSTDLFCDRAGRQTGFGIDKSFTIRHNVEKHTDSKTMIASTVYGGVLAFDRQDYANPGSFRSEAITDGGRKSRPIDSSTRCHRRHVAAEAHGADLFQCCVGGSLLQVGPDNHCQQQCESIKKDPPATSKHSFHVSTAQIANILCSLNPRRAIDSKKVSTEWSMGPSSTRGVWESHGNRRAARSSSRTHDRHHGGIPTRPGYPTVY